ncbi:hypothetical protein BD311DRAFT_362694 [Dichomitus squalens]|uniref:Transmembrane protein n=1 Tax=Dichomitus squalens TaxID=114155 RepID=A0A4Q9MP91_9APHY|nr:hypothetical protein BD311DRAFT_362694 [Dichomitus squalens]
MLCQCTTSLDSDVLLRHTPRLSPSFLGILVSVYLSCLPPFLSPRGGDAAMEGCFAHLEPSRECVADLGLLSLPRILLPHPFRFLPFSTMLPPFLFSFSFFRFSCLCPSV